MGSAHCLNASKVLAKALFRRPTYPLPAGLARVCNPCELFDGFGGASMWLGYPFPFPIP